MAKRKKTENPSQAKVKRSTRPAAAAGGKAGALPPDQQQRDAILTQLDTTMLVEASAGAGKTRSMVERMIALLREDKSSIETLAAITFTRKAAAELRARFQVALEKAVREAAGADRERLARAAQHAGRAFVGTIHSFCGRLLRERPVEAGVEPSFQELDDATDTRLRQEAWNRYVDNLTVSGDSLLNELDEVGLRIGDLSEAFLSFATYPDVEEWPTEQVTLPDLAPARESLRNYVAHLEGLLPTLPSNPENDKLMPKISGIVRMVRHADLERPAELMEILGEFGEPGKTTVVQKKWPGGKAQALEELERWDQFVAQTAAPLVSLWLQVRYPVALRALEGAVGIYDQLRQELGGLNYQDLLLRAADLLRDNSKIREYFRRRFTHLLVDEFQDTDPVQAEVMLLLTATDANETNWRRVRPVPGSLFVVGDPKQSIYRFRRADIVTYSEVKRIIEANGQVIRLTANFRSLDPVIDWVNTTFDQVFPATSDSYSPERCSMDAVRGDDDEGHAGEVAILKIPAEHGKNEEAVAFESAAIADAIQAAVAEADGPSAAKPGDFLIIAALKRNLCEYSRELAERGIPCEVTGGAVLNEVRELALLCRCLEAVVDPDNPVSLVAVLRSELFGVSDGHLYLFRRAGGRFAVHAPLPDGLPPALRGLLEDAFGRLKRYGSWLKRLPPVAAIERIAADLGLPAWAAVNAGGNVRAGSIGRAMELLRAAQSTAFSISEVVAYLRQLIDGQEPHDGLPAAESPNAPVRIMNLQPTFSASPTNF